MRLFRRWDRRRNHRSGRRNFEGRAEFAVQRRKKSSQRLAQAKACAEVKQQLVQPGSASQNPCGWLGKPRGKGGKIMSIQASTAALRRSGQGLFLPPRCGPSRPAGGFLTAFLSVLLATLGFQQCAYASQQKPEPGARFRESLQQVAPLSPDPCIPSDGEEPVVLFSND